MRFLYKKILKPILFSYKADDVHIFFLKMGQFLGSFFVFRFFVGLFLNYKNKFLNQRVCGIKLENPVGLAAGFDYDACLIEILPFVGFGYHTIGTITNSPYEGNERPMLGRLPKSRSLLVNKGFKNNGIDFIVNKVYKRKKRIPLGISIGATNICHNDVDEMVLDVSSSFKKAVLLDYFDYYELNISCPNLINVKNVRDNFDTPKGLSILLNKLSTLKINKPVLIKMYLEKSVEETFALVKIASYYDFVSGFIFANLVKDRTNNYFDKEEVDTAGRGNFSGKPTEELSNNLISEIYKNFKDRFVIVGCGGIFSAEDAYEKIKRGASLVQLITGMVYEGPSLIKDINKDLVKLATKDGYQNISQAIGSYYK